MKTGRMRFGEEPMERAETPTKSFEGMRKSLMSRHETKVDS